MNNTFSPCIIKCKDTCLDINNSSIPSLLLSKYKYIFNKSKSIVLNTIIDFYYFKYILNQIKFNSLITKKKNIILYLINSIYDKNQFVDAIYYYIGNCKFSFFYENNLDKLKSLQFIEDAFIKDKVDYIFIPNMFYKYPNILLREYQFNQLLTKIINLILIYQNVEGSVTLIIPEINNRVSIELIYLLSRYYKKIRFTTKAIEILTCGMCNQHIITCQFFKGIQFEDINKLHKIIKKWSYIDHSNGFTLNITTPTVNYKLKNNKYYPFNEYDHSNFVKSIFKWKTPIPEKFIEKINILNKYFKIRRNKIIKSQQYLKKMNKKKLQHIQINYAINWCKQHDIDIDPYYILYWNTTNNSNSEKIIKISKNRLRYFFPKIDGVSFIKLQVSNIGDYSITPTQDSYKMARLLFESLPKFNKEYIITDATSGNAGNTIHFAHFFHKVNAVDISETHCKICQNNIKTYKLNNVNVIHANYLTIMNQLEQDVVFLDPPWGGPNYKKYAKVPLYLGQRRLDNIVSDLFESKAAMIIGIKIPYNFDLTTFYEHVHYKYINIYNFKKCKLLIVRCY